MKSVRMVAMVLTFVSLVGGYFLHQYFWFSGPEGLKHWSDQMLPITLVLGWILLVGAIMLGLTKPDEEAP